MSEIKRDDDGKFLKGTAGGPGRPARERERLYLAALTDAVGLDDWREIIATAVSDAKGGCHRSRQWLSDYLLGKPMQRNEIRTSDEHVSATEIRSQLIFEILAAVETKESIVIGEEEIDQIIAAEIIKRDGASTQPANL